MAALGARCRRATTLDRRWRAQIEELQLPAVDPRSGWMRGWAEDEGFDQPQSVDTIVAVLADLLSLPPLEQVLPPPGSADITNPADSSTTAAAGAETNPILGRIRGLLVKAESTTFEAEAVAAVEMLFTSLLVQAQAAMADAAKRAPAGTRPRSQRYRSAFLLGYANRIDDRLTEINRGVIAEAEAEHGSSFLPVLRSREDAVADFMTERFGELISSRVRGGWDFAGHSSGQLAADRAQLAFGDLPEEAAAS